MAPENGREPTERRWVVEAPVFQGEDEDGVLHIEYGQINPDEAAQAGEDLAAVCRVLGGVGGIVTEREEIEPGVFVTRRQIFRWHSFVPSKRIAQQPPVQEAEVVQPEPGAEPEEQVAAGQ